MNRIKLIESIEFVPTKDPIQEAVPVDDPFLKTIQEAQRPTHRTVIEGIFQHADKLNINKRIYPKKMWEKILDENSPAMQAIRGGAMIGHVEHPSDGATDLNKAAIKIIDLKMREDGAIIGRAIVYRIGGGLVVQELIDTNTKFGISSRGTGSIDDAGIVQEDFELDSFDIVARPSTIGAFPVAVPSKRAQEDVEGVLTYVIAGKTKARENDRLLLKQHGGEVVGEAVQGERGLYRFPTPEAAAAFAKAVDGRVMPAPKRAAGATNESIAAALLADTAPRNTPMTLADILKKLVEVANGLIADAKSTKEARTKAAADLRATIMVGEVSEDVALKDPLAAAKLIAAQLETMTSDTVPSAGTGGNGIPGSGPSGVPAPAPPTARKAPEPATTQPVGTNSGGAPMCKEHAHALMGSDGKCPLCVAPGPTNKNSTTPGPNAPDQDKANTASPTGYGNYEAVIANLRDTLKDAGAEIVRLTSEKEALAASNTALTGKVEGLSATTQKQSEQIAKHLGVIATLTSVDVAGQVAQTVEALVRKHPALADFRDVLASQASPVAVEAKAARLLHTIDDKRRNPTSANGGQRPNAALESRIKSRRASIVAEGQHPGAGTKSEDNAGNVTSEETPIPRDPEQINESQRKSVNLAAGAVSHLTRKSGGR